MPLFHLLAPIKVCQPGHSFIAHFSSCSALNTTCMCLWICRTLRSQCVLHRPSPSTHHLLLLSLSTHAAPLTGHGLGIHHPHYSPSYTHAITPTGNGLRIHFSPLSTHAITPRGHSQYSPPTATTTIHPITPTGHSQYSPPTATHHFPPSTGHGLGIRVAWNAARLLRFSRSRKPSRRAAVGLQRRHVQRCVRVKPCSVRKTPHLFSCHVQRSVRVKPCSVRKPPHLCSWP